MFSLMEQDALLGYFLGQFEWKKALDRIESHPQEVRKQYHGKTSLLHAFACLSTGRAPPIELIREMILLCPRMITEGTQSTGETALHLLFRYKSILNTQYVNDMCVLLIQTDQMSLMMRDMNGWLPLHSLFHVGTDAGIISGNKNFDPLITPDWLAFLVRPYPESIIYENKGGITPMQMLWNNFALDNEGRCTLDCEDIIAYYYNEVVGQESLKWYFSSIKKNDPNLWECILQMVRLTDLHHNVGSTTPMRAPKDIFRPLHKIASSSLVTREIMETASKIHGREMYDEDIEGNLPLHCACASVHRQNNEEVIKTLVNIFPDAAGIRNVKGYLPLVLALENGSHSWERDIKCLVDAYPGALAEKDLVRMMYPCMVLASVDVNGKQLSKDERCETLDCLFHLVRACPELIC